MVKQDGSVLVHSDFGAKALNWFSAPCHLVETDGTWIVTNKSGETLTIQFSDVVYDISYELGEEPGLVKDGVEDQLQRMLAADVSVFGADWRLIRREFPTPIGPVDLLCKDAADLTVAVEVKRRGGIDGVEQLTRYLEFLNRDPLLRPVRGVLAAQVIAPQAKVLAQDRGISCVTLDYEELGARERQVEDAFRLF